MTLSRAKAWETAVTGDTSEGLRLAHLLSELHTTVGACKEDGMKLSCANLNLKGLTKLDKILWDMCRAPKLHLRKRSFLYRTTRTVLVEKDIFENICKLFGKGERRTYAWNTAKEICDVCIDVVDKEIEELRGASARARVV
jgi:hypothetical protein